MDSAGRYRGQAARFAEWRLLDADPPSVTD
jgi:hypothetical protein